MKQDFEWALEFEKAFCEHLEWVGIPEVDARERWSLHGIRMWLLLDMTSNPKSRNERKGSETIDN